MAPVKSSQAPSCFTESVQPLSSQSLSASSSTGTDPRHLLYRVVRGPQLGRLLHAQQGSAEEALVNFTQAEVRTSLLSHHTHPNLTSGGCQLEPLYPWQLASLDPAPAQG